MKNFWCIAFSFYFCLLANAQEQKSFNSILELGKAEFKKDFESQDYEAAIRYLNEAIEMNPQSAEAHYFLAYAYSRLNSKDGKSMIKMHLEETLKCSEALEKVIQLSPEYKGEIIVLDPYSKITAEWGSQAMSYWHNNQKDSAIWAFNEGKRRGGFGNYFLSICRTVLDECDPNAILISSGDNFTIYLWYLQIIEDFRKDVSVVDISLLNTVWYPKYLRNENIVQFDTSAAVIDRLEYQAWNDSLVTINGFSWVIKPSYLEHYLLRGDLVFMSLLRANAFERTLYFSSAFPESSQLSLTPYLQNHFLFDKLVIDQKEPDESNSFLFAHGIDYFQKAIVTTEQLNPNSSDEKRMLDYIRLQGLYFMQESIEQNQIPNAFAISLILNEYANSTEYPYQQEQVKAFEEHLKGQLK